MKSIRILYVHDDELPVYQKPIVSVICQTTELVLDVKISDADYAIAAIKEFVENHIREHREYK